MSHVSPFNFKTTSLVWTFEGVDGKFIILAIITKHFSLGARQGILAKKLLICRLHYDKFILTWFLRLFLGNTRTFILVLGDLIHQHKVNREAKKKTHMNFIIFCSISKLFLHHNIIMDISINKGGKSLLFEQSLILFCVVMNWFIEFGFGKSFIDYLDWTNMSWV